MDDGYSMIDITRYCSISSDIIECHGGYKKIVEKN